MQVTGFVPSPLIAGSWSAEAICFLHTDLHIYQALSLHPLGDGGTVILALQTRSQMPERQWHFRVACLTQKEPGHRPFCHLLLLAPGPDLRPQTSAGTSTPWVHRRMNNSTFVSGFWTLFLQVLGIWGSAPAQTLCVCLFYILMSQWSQLEESCSWKLLQKTAESQSSYYTQSSAL